MWDALAGPDAAHPDMVLEFKTTKRSEDWLTDVPEYYALQAALAELYPQYSKTTETYKLDCAKLDA